MAETSSRQLPAAEEDVHGLVAASVAGDRSAFAQLYQLYAPKIIGHLRRLLAQEDVDDAAQKVFIEAHRALNSFAGRARFSTWLHGIAYRVALGELRRRRAWWRVRERLSAERDLHLAGTESPEQSALERGELKRAQQLLEGLKPERRLAFVLFYVEDLPIEEVAARLGTREEAARQRAKRARRDLRRALERAERKPGKRTRTDGHG